MVIGPRNDHNVFDFGKPQFRVSLRLQYGWPTENSPTT